MPIFPRTFFNPTYFFLHLFLEWITIFVFYCSSHSFSSLVDDKEKKEILTRKYPCQSYMESATAFANIYEGY